MERTPFPNGKELITIEWKSWEGNTDTLALYKEEYLHGGGLALFMWDITINEPWGDVTVNLPGHINDPDDNLVFLNEWVSPQTLQALKGIIKPTGYSTKYNMGEYELVEVKKSIIPKIPSYKELMDMIYSEGNDEVTPTL